LKNQREKSRGLVFLVFLGVVALNVLIAEMILSLFFPQPLYAIRYSPWGWEHIPNISFTYVPESKESISKVEYNSDGFRGRYEYARDVPEGTFRVALLGDSQVEGNMVDRGNHSTFIAVNLLNRHPSILRSEKYSRVELINAGVYGYEPCQFLRLFEARVMQYRPDLVYVLHFSKFADEVFCGLKEGKLVFEDLEYSEFQYKLRYLLNYVRAKSQLVNYVYRIYRYHFGGGIHLPEKLHQEMFTYEPPTMPASSKSIVNSPSLVEYTHAVASGEGKGPTKKSRQLMRAVYRRLDALVSSYGGNLRILIGHTDKKNEVLVDDLKDAGIPYFDLASYLKDNKEQDVTFPLAAHWNEHGHQLVGNALVGLVAELDMP